jgi:hypothetical protein
VLYDGKLVADHPIGGTRFQNIMEKEVGINAKGGHEGTGSHLVF